MKEDLRIHVIVGGSGQRDRRKEENAETCQTPKQVRTFNGKYLDAEGSHRCMECASGTISANGLPHCSARTKSGCGLSASIIPKARKTMGEAQQFQQLRKPVRGCSSNIGGINPSLYG